MVAKQAKREQGKLPDSVEAISGRAISNASELGFVTIEIASGAIKEVHRGHKRGAWVVPDDWLLAPGLVDLQVNGIGGIHIASAPERLREISRLLPQSGVTAYLATLPSATSSELHALGTVFDELGEEQALAGFAEPLGIHLEGPAISPARAGAHPLERIRNPAEVIDYLNSAWVRLLTLAPELPGSNELIECAKANGISLAAGHTDGTYEDGVAAIEAGIGILTHTFNAMRPLAHREPGLVGAYLEDLRTTICVIADGAHVSPAVVSLLWRLKGPGNLALVSDAIALTRAGATEPNGETRFETTGPSDSPLMGGTTNLADGLARLHRYGCAPLPYLLDAASAIPAAAVGFANRGSLSAGNAADIIAIDQHGNLQATWCRARLAWSQGS